MTPPARLPTVHGAAEVMEPLGYVLARAPAPGAEQDWDCLWRHPAALGPGGVPPRTDRPMATDLRM